MATEIFYFWLLGAEKMGFKVINPMSKIKLSQASFLWTKLELKHLCLPYYEYFYIVFLKHFLSSIIFFCGRGIDTQVKGCVFTSQYSQDKLDLRKVNLVMLLDIGLPTLNPIFSAPKNQKYKISVPISKRISWGFQNSPYFYS